jgi:hypothetical protein
VTVRRRLPNNLATKRRRNSTLADSPDGHLISAARLRQTRRSGAPLAANFHHLLER